MTEQDAFDKRLSEAWQALSPPSGLEARVRAQLPAQSALGPSLRTHSRGVTGWRALRASGGFGAAAGTLLLALGFIAGYLTRPAPVAPLRTHELADAPAQGAPSGAALPVPSTLNTPPLASAPGTEPAAPELTAAPSAPLAAPAPTGKEHTLGSPPRVAMTRRTSRPAARAPNDELSLLERAERAVRAHNPDLALALASELERRHPSTALDEERRAIELMALCQSGSSRARRLGERFLQRYPESVYAARISTECGPSPTIRSTSDIDDSEGGIHAKPDSQ
jgi:hypothetical protein